MIYPDLAARTCGFMGVFGTLITLGVMDTPEFLITPQPSYSPLELQIVSTNQPSLEAPAEKTEEVSEEAATAQSEVPPTPVEPPVETPEPAPVEPAEPEPAPQPEPEPAPEPTPVPPENPQASELMVKPEPKPEPKPEVKPQPEPKPEVKPKPAPKPEAKPKPKPQPKAPAKVAAKQTKPTQSQTGQAAKPQPAPSQAVTTAQDQLAKQRLQSQVANLLVQEIKRKLRYPRNAVRRKLEGVVQVEFSVSQGKILSFKLSKSSGHKILDDAAKKLAQGMIDMSLPVNAQDTVVVVPIKYELL